MFDQTFVDTHAHTRKPWTFSASIAMQTGFVAMVLIAPLMHPEILRPKIEAPIWIPLRAVTQPPPEALTREPVTRKNTSHSFVAPTRVPDRVAKIVDAGPMDAPDNSAVLGAVPGMASSGIVPGLNIRPIPDSPPPAKVPAPEKAAPPRGPMTVSTGVQDAKLIFGPKPDYPAIAKASRTQGTVRLQAIVAIDGRIRNLRVISGPALLQKAALDAVSQWRYQATLLNGVPVEVLTEIDVHFTLGQ